jgi:hypothetical protein
LKEGVKIKVEEVKEETPSDIVEKTVKDLRYSKADKSMIKEAEKDPRFYTLKEGVKIKVEEVKEEKDIDISEIGLVGKGEKGIVDTLVAIDQIVNIGSKVWNMVVENKPVVKVESKYAVALPMGVKSASELSGWSRPKSHVISFYFENLYGIDVIRVSYRVTYVYGGSYQGRGKYLAAVYAIPESVDVMWGFSFNMQAYVPDATVVNVGTSANPIAALQLKVSWSASSVLKEIDGTGVYYIQGDGYFEEIASPIRRNKTDLKNIKIE